MVAYGVDAVERDGGFQSIANRSSLGEAIPISRPRSNNSSSTFSYTRGNWTYISRVSRMISGKELMQRNGPWTTGLEIYATSASAITVAQTLPRCFDSAHSNRSLFGGAMHNGVATGTYLCRLAQRVKRTAQLCAPLRAIQRREQLCMFVATFP